MADPVVSAMAEEWRYQPNSFLLSYCNGQHLDPGQYYVDTRSPDGATPMMYDIYARSP